MKNKNYSIKERIYNLILTDPETLFSSSELLVKYNKRYSEKIDIHCITKYLYLLWKRNKIIRTETQTNKGFVYNLNDLKKINKVYDEYLIPPNFKNRLKLKDLMMQNKFERLSNKAKMISINKMLLAKKYGEEYFDKKETKLFLAKLVAFVMGDGHINRCLDNTSFFFKEEYDAILFKQDFLRVFYKEKLTISKTQYCYKCSICSVSLAKLLIILGAPIGNKVHISFSIPDWILNGPDYIKIGFLSVIYGNEGSKPKDNRWRIQFVISKDKEHLEDLLIFTNQIKAMLYHFNISASFTQMRKQENRHYYARFYVKRKENLHKFYKLLEFSYASEKQDVLNALILKGNSF